MDLLKANSEAQANVEKIVLSVGTPKKLRQVHAKESLPHQFKMQFLDAGILQENTKPELPQKKGEQRGATGHRRRWQDACSLTQDFPMWCEERQLFTRNRSETWLRDEEKISAPQSWCELCYLSFQLVNFLVLVAQSSQGRGTETSASSNPRHRKKSFWVTLKEAMETWFAYPTHARWWKFEIWSKGVWSGLNTWQHREAPPTR